MKRLGFIALLVTLASPFAHATELAITVDDIPSHQDDYPWMNRREILAGILSVLQKNGVPGVYGFANGWSLVQNPSDFDMYKQWIASGYPLGNHTLSHWGLSSVSTAKYIADIEKEDAILARVEDEKTRRVFRYPFLDEGSAAKAGVIREYLDSHGYQIAEVTVDYWDWAWNEAYIRCRQAGDAASIERLKADMINDAVNELHKAERLSRSVFGRDIKNILLLHHAAVDTETLEPILEAFRKEGVTFIPFSEAAGDPVYRQAPKRKGIGTFLELAAEPLGIQTSSRGDDITTRIHAYCPVGRKRR